jgi:hypothetical protein
VGVCALIRDEEVRALDRFGFDVGGDRSNGVGGVPADAIQNRPRRVGDTDRLALDAVDRVPDRRGAPIGGGEHRLAVDLAGRAPPLGVAVGDVLVGPVRERRPGAGGRERADPPPTGLPALGAVAVSLDQFEGVREVVAIPHGLAGKADDGLRNVAWIARHHDEPGVGVRIASLGGGEFLPGAVEGSLRVDRRMDRERRVPAGLVLDSGMEAHEQGTLDRVSAPLLGGVVVSTPGGRLDWLAEPVGDPRREVRRAHPPLAGVGVVHRDDGHRPPFSR